MFELPASTARGLTVPLCYRTIYKFDPVRGWVTQYEYHGIGLEEAESLSNWAALSGMANELTEEGDKATLSITDATSEYAIDSWEIVATEDTPDLLSHPTLTEAVGSLTGFDYPGEGGSVGTDFSQVFQSMRQSLENNDNLYDFSNDGIISYYFVDDSDPDTKEVTWNAQGQIVATFYQLYQQGTTGFRNPQYVLRHKANISNRWTVFVQDWGVEEIYTPAQMLSEVGSAGLWVFPLPASMQFTLANIPIPMVGQQPTTTTGYQWGWLKSATTRTTEGLNRVNLEVTYTLQLWSVVVYDPYNGMGASGGDS